MKSLFSFIFLCFGLTNLTGQTMNNSFEEWESRTYTLDLAEVITTFDPDLDINLPPETYDYRTPVGWTAANQMSNSQTLAGFDLVVKDSTLNIEGNYSLQIKTIGHTIFLFGENELPGFVISGEFELNPDFFVDVLLTGAGLDFTKLDGAGHAINKRPESLSGYLDYLPANYDSAWIYSMLVKTLKDGTKKLIAEAEYIHNYETNGMIPFTAAYTYYSCATPDTIITYFGASYLDGEEEYTGVDGSVLTIDALELIMPDNPILLPPNLQGISFTIDMNQSKELNVLINDTFCEDDEKLLQLIVEPMNGSITQQPNNNLIYTPFSDFTGTDFFSYTACNSHGCDTADVFIDVVGTSSISEQFLSSLKIFPNPAEDAFQIKLAGNFKTNAQLYSIKGNLILEKDFMQESRIQTNSLPTGVYFLHLQNEHFQTVKKVHIKNR